MQRRMTLAACALMLSLAGCQSMAVAALKRLDEKPYSLPVAARELQEIPGPREAALAAPASETFAAAAAEPQQTAATPTPASVPARTDIRGAGDGSMKLDRVVITGSDKKIPHKVPDFSREQIASMVCRTTGRPDKAVEAYKATVFAHETRLAFEAGQRTTKQTDDAEKKRQETVRELLPSGMLVSMFGARQKKGDLPRPMSRGLAIENADLFTFTENGVEVMAVSGVVRNTGTARTELPPLTLEALDRWEFILAGQTSLLPFEALEPGETRTFEMRFLNPPDTTAEVYVHFAPPFEYRARRDCDFFDPLTLDLTQFSNESPAVAQVLAKATTGASPIHTAAELNILTRAYREQAAAAWNCRDGKDSEPPKGGLQFAKEGAGERAEGFSISISMGKPNMEAACAPAAKRLRWRDAFALAEATDEAWGAQRASEEARRRLAAGQATQADVDAADVAQQRAYALFRELGAKALARIGGSAPDVDIEIASSSFGYAGFDKGGRYVEFSGKLRNMGTSPRRIDALMLALVDRLEQPMTSVTLDYTAELAPGESKDFSQRLSMYEPVRRESADTPPVWQIRVGAMGR